MKRLLPSLFFSAACLAAPGPETLETLVAQWVDLRAQHSAAQRAWAAEQQHLQTEIRLLEAEKVQRQEAKARIDAHNEEAVRARAGQEQRRQELQRDLDVLDADLWAAEQKLRQTLDQLPEPLRTRAAETRTSLPEQQDEARSLDTVRRVQVVLAASRYVDALQRGVHSGVGVLEIEGTRREMDLLFLGTAAGYAVSRNDRMAAVGRPGPQGWVWRSAPEQAAAIRQALNIAEGKAPAAYVPLLVEGVSP